MILGSWQFHSRLREFLYFFFYFLNFLNFLKILVTETPLTWSETAKIPKSQSHRNPKALHLETNSVTIVVATKGHEHGK